MTIGQKPGVKEQKLSVRENVPVRNLDVNVLKSTNQSVELMVKIIFKNKLWVVVVCLSCL